MNAQAQTQAQAPAQTQPNPGILATLGIFGFQALEPLVLASLVTGDPLLLIGRSGTGKTYLLNSLSEALRLTHRHLNAALVAFDDLVGFPYPAKDGKSIVFLQTPASIWDAESILIDEISRAHPEVQNKFFSIIHEMRLHGMPLEKLVYRWAAMNPPSLDPDQDDSETSSEDYIGSQPLDAALADRFAMLITVPDWKELSISEQLAVVNPAGEGALSSDDGTLADLILRAKAKFQARVQNLEPEFHDYVRRVATLLEQAGTRLSPRRTRIIARNIAAVLSLVEARQGTDRITAESRELFELLRSVLHASLPQRATGVSVPDTVLDSAHAEAFRGSLQGEDASWLSELALTPDASQMVTQLLHSDVDIDLRSLGLQQMLSTRNPARRAVFVMSLAPLIHEPGLFNEEARQALGKWIPELFVVDGSVESFVNSPMTRLPAESQLKACKETVKQIRQRDPNAAKRLDQLFHYLILQGHTSFKPSKIRRLLEACMQASAQWAASNLSSVTFPQQPQPQPQTAQTIPTTQTLEAAH